MASEKWKSKKTKRQEMIIEKIGGGNEFHRWAKYRIMRRKQISFKKKQKKTDLQWSTVFVLTHSRSFLSWRGAGSWRGSLVDAVQIHALTRTQVHCFFLFARTRNRYQALLCAFVLRRFFFHCCVHFIYYSHLSRTIHRGLKVWTWHVHGRKPLSHKLGGEWVSGATE